MPCPRRILWPRLCPRGTGSQLGLPHIANILCVMSAHKITNFEGGRFTIGALYKSIYLITQVLATAAASIHFTGSTFSREGNICDTLRCDVAEKSRNLFTTPVFNSPVAGIPSEFRKYVLCSGKP